MVVVEGTIKGKARPRHGKSGVYTPIDTVSYENWVKTCYQQQDRRYLEGSIRANIFVYHKVPKSYSQKKIQAIRQGLEYPQKTPDVDNIAKIVLDSLNKIAYEDDKQIAELTVIKRFTEDLERVEFELEVIR
jgi:Holliday junction resolvase RusA-like endonuclease